MKKRIFISFAIEDKTTRDLFVGQAKNSSTPFEIVDMSVKTPWDSAWKTKCRERINSCSGVIVLVTPNLPKADGALWEIKCAKELGKPIRGIYANGGTFFNEPADMFGAITSSWKWDNIKSFLDEL